MELSLLGASREVGRSGVLLETEDSRVVLDYGVKLMSDNSQKPVYPLPINGFLDAVILSHAHLDHSGAVPLLFQSSEPVVYSTKPTFDIAQILLDDSIKINKLKKQETFYMKDVKRMMRASLPIKREKQMLITKDLSLELFDAGHILGASFTQLESKDQTLLYTGDYNDVETLVHTASVKPPKSDVVVVEATYGDREHPPRKEHEKLFIEEVKKVLDEGGNVLLPAFAVGRSQELVTMLFHYGIDVPIYMDGMSKAITEIYLDYPKFLNGYDEMYRAMKKCNWVTRKTRDSVLDDPSVVVSTAGMMSGGPILQYILDVRDHPNSAIFFTGFQVEGTPGHTFLNEKKYATDVSTLDYSNYNVQKFDFSAHCDKHGIHKLIKEADPTLVIINHGEEDQCISLKEWVEDNTGCYCAAPKLREKFNVAEYK